MNILGHLFRYNRWANLALWDFCIPLSRDQLMAQAPATAYGAYGCLVHLLLSEEDKYQQASGEALDLPEFDRNNLRPLAELRGRVAAVADRYISLAATIDGEQMVTAEWEGEHFARPAYVPILECIQHSSEHREQAKAGLSVAGLTPPDIQVWVWNSLGRP